MCPATNVILVTLYSSLATPSYLIIIGLLLTEVRKALCDL